MTGTLGAPIVPGSGIVPVLAAPLTPGIATVPGTRVNPPGVGFAPPNGPYAMNPAGPPGFEVKACAKPEAGNAKKSARKIAVQRPVIGLSFGVNMEMPGTRTKPQLTAAVPWKSGLFAVVLRKFTLPGCPTASPGKRPSCVSA
jgi:hypothetical protein